MKKHIPGWILTALMAVVMALLDVRLYTSQLLPVKLIILIGAFLLVLLLIVCLLLWDSKRFGRFICGTILFLVVTGGMAVGTYFLQGALSTINRITGTQTQISHVSVYTTADSDIQSLEDLVGKPVGILASRDRENTDETLKDIEKKLNNSLSIVEFEGLTEMTGSLLEHEIDAMIVNEAFLPLLKETEGFEGIDSRIREITKIQVERPAPTAEATKPNGENNTSSVENSKGEESFVVFLSGIDTYGAVTAQSRSDTNILAAVNTKTHQVLLLSTPRDYFVPLSISNGAKDKLTHAGLYGVEVSMDTLGMLYDIDVDYYFRVNFSGFEDVVNALGGITVYSEYNFTSSVDHVTSFYVGDNDVNGAQALLFARERYAFGSGDNQRGKNQMEVIKGIIRKALSPSILSSYTDLLAAMEGSFQMSVPYEVLAGIVRDQLESGGSWNIVSYSVTGFGNSAVPYSMDTAAYVMDPDWETVDHAKELIAQVFSGETLTQE